MNYSVNADFEKQILPSAAIIRTDDPKLHGFQLLTKSLHMLQANYAKPDKDLTHTKSIAYGIPCVGKDILGAALRHAMMVSSPISTVDEVPQQLMCTMHGLWIGNP